MQLIAPAHHVNSLQFLCTNSDEAYVRSCVVSTAATFLTLNYKWGGISPEQGFDCSGLVMEVLQSFGFQFPRVISPVQLKRSQYLFEVMRNDQRDTKIKPGDILWFGADIKSITHIAIAISDFLMIEAGGEGREATDIGSVRIRPIRKDLVAFRSPVNRILSALESVKYESLK